MSTISRSGRELRQRMLRRAVLQRLQTAAFQGLEETAGIEVRNVAKPHRAQQQDPGKPLLH